MMKRPLTSMRLAPLAAALLPALALVGCGTAPQQQDPAAPAVATPARPAKPRQEPGVPVLPPAGSGRGGYYQDDGPGENPPPNLMETPDAEVRNDPPIPRANREYVVFGKTYRPITDPDLPFVQRGLGTWYGKKFHGQRTSSGELYDMYKMTAAHPTLPIPSYARVTNLDNGNQVVVRINDRGPFHSTRIIDVSYTAALKLGLLAKGSHQLEVVRILPAEAEKLAAANRNGARPATVLRPQAPQPQRPPAQTAMLLYPPPPVGGAQRPAGAEGSATSATQGTAAVPTAVATPVPAAASTTSAMQGAALMPATATTPATAGTGAVTPATMSTVAAGAGARPAVPASATGAVPPQPSAAPAGLVQAGGPAAPAGGAIMPAAAAKVGYYLQLGAYAKPENAEAARARVAMESGLAGLEVIPSGAVLRLYSGPFNSRQEAEQAMLALPTSLGLKPLVIQR